MSILGFEKFNLKEIAKKIKKNPERLLLGAIDPASTKLWSKVLGKDYDPMVDQMGGPTGDTYRKAADAGISTGAAKGLHNVAHVVAGTIAGGYGLNQLGVGGAAAGSEAGAAGGSSGGVGTALSSADKAALFGDAGYGAGMSGAETSAYDAGVAGAGKFSLGDLTRWQGAGGQQPQQQRRLEEVEYRPDDINSYMASASAMQPSSKKLKTPRRSLGDAIGRGVRDEDPIDSNGVEVAAIQALSKRIDGLIERAAKLRAKKGKRHG